MLPPRRGGCGGVWDVIMVIAQLSILCRMFGKWAVAPNMAVHLSTQRAESECVIVVVVVLLARAQYY